MNSTPQIPIQNIYYLFCYAWNRFEEAKAVSVGAEASPDLPNLLAKVLLNSSRMLLRRGLDREYRLHSDAIATVRGHIDIDSSLKLRAKRARRLQCEFDELTADVLHNQILKASMLRIARAPTIDHRLAHDLRTSSQRFVGVSDIMLKASTFSKVRLHRNNAYYELALRICELAFECLIPNPDGVGFTFHDILRDERKMARVFEDFVRNFYRIEQRYFLVKHLSMHWPATSVSNASTLSLPRLIPDLFLTSDKRSIILDTKYYSTPTVQRYDTETYISGHLYQIFSYVEVAQKTSAVSAPVGGILLYAKTNDDMLDIYNIDDTIYTIASIDLSLPWPYISSRLLHLIGLSK